MRLVLIASSALYMVVFGDWSNSQYMKCSSEVLLSFHPGPSTPFHPSLKSSFHQKWNGRGLPAALKAGDVKNGPFVTGVSFPSKPVV
jgi:hypothetical protein